MKFRLLCCCAILGCTVILIGALIALGTEWKKRTAHQQKANATEWRWDKERVSLDYCAKHNLHGYTLETVRRENAFVDDTLQISVFDGADEVCTFRGHEETVFVQIDDMLYVIDVCPISPGSALVAYDLKKRTQLWTCPLRGNPPGCNSCYRHRVNIEVDGDTVVVFGSESNGRYIEYVDTKSGQTVGHRKLPSDYSSHE